MPPPFFPPQTISKMHYLQPNNNSFHTLHFLKITNQRSTHTQHLSSANITKLPPTQTHTKNTKAPSPTTKQIHLVLPFVHNYLESKWTIIRFSGIVYV